jgi:zinc/manganese transport system permease protein
MDIAFSIMKWPLLACLLLPALLVYYGLHIVRRGIIFVDLALAQVATLGTCLCILLGHDPMDLHTYLWSLGFTFLGALIFTFTRNGHNHRVPQEALIGIVYVVAAAASILLLSRSSEGNEELKKTLVGDVLTVSSAQVWKTFALYAAIAVVHFIFRRKFLAISFDPENAKKTGIKVRFWDFLFYALFGLVVTSFVQIGGVLLVFSYLIVPAVCANLLARGLGALLLIGCVMAILGGVGGLYASYKFDLPTGAAIVCALGALLIFVGAVAKLRSGEKKLQE